MKQKQAGLKLTVQMVQMTWAASSRAFLSLFFLSSLQGISALALAWISKLLFDLIGKALSGTAINITQELLPILFAQAVLMIIIQTIGPSNQFVRAEFSRRLSIKVQTEAYRKINQLPDIAYFEDPQFYDTFRLATQGAQNGPSMIVDNISNLTRYAITLLSFSSLLLAFNPLLAIPVGLVTLPQLYAELKMGRQRFRLVSELSPSERKSFYYSYLLSTIYPAKEIRLFNLGDYFLGKFRQVIHGVHQSQRAQDARELRWSFFLNGFSSVVSTGAFIWVVIQGINGKMSLGDILLYTSAVSSVTGSLSGLVTVLSQMNENTLFFSHYRKLMSLPPKLILPATPLTISTLTSSIELKNVSFRYSDRHPWVLRNVNLTIPAGSCLALVGANGAGKTTLVKLLTRLYDPTHGDILWNGIDIRDLDPQDLRGRIGVIFQDFMRYDLTAWENIGIGDVKRIHDLGVIRQAAARAGINKTIEDLSEGYDTILSRWLAGDDAGADLSGGEWQKVAIARMLMRESDFLILDEPTAFLDAQAEFEIYCRFSELVKNRTSLLISHRFSTVRMADFIAVLENGVIIEVGTHEDLLSRKGRYAVLYKSQAERYQ